jgi:hypothetical protein
MPQLGISKGLSFVNDWEKDIDRVYQREEYAAGARARKEQDAMFWANQLKKGHGSTPYLEGKYDAFAKEQTKKIADFAIANPGFRTDVTKLAKFQNLTGALLDNPILQQDLQVKAQYEKFQAAVAGNNLTKLQIEKEHKKYNEYANADPNSDATPYVFENPKVITIPDLLKEDASLLEPRTDVILNQSTHQYEDVTSVPIENIQTTAERRYSSEEGKLAINKEYIKTLEEHPEYASIPGYENALSWYAKSLEYLTEKKNSYRTYDYKWQQDQRRAAGEGKEIVSPYAYIQRISKLKDIPDGGSIKATSYDLAWTRNEEKGGLTNITPSSGDLIWSKKGGKEGKGGYVAIDLNVTAKAIGASEIVNIGGIFYVKTDFSFESGGRNEFTASTPDIPNALIEDYGLHSSDIVSMPIAGMNTQSAKGFKPGQLHEGTMLTPMIIEDTRATNYDKMYLGQSYAEKTSSFYESELNSKIQADPMLLKHVSKAEQRAYMISTYGKEAELDEKTTYEGIEKGNAWKIKENGKWMVVDISTGGKFEIN